MRRLPARYGWLVRPGLAVLLAQLVLVVGSGCRRAEQQGAAQPPPGAHPDAAMELDKYWLNAKEEVDKSVLEIMAQHQAELARGIHYRKFLRGDPRKKQVAITFDDGPHPDYTPRLLDILKQHSAPATFFLVGEMAEKAPDLVRAETAAGHNIGNHTYHHVNLTRIPNESIATEIKACGEVLQSITGTPPHLFRPPGGDYDGQVAEAAEALGYTMVLWTDDPGDYASPGETTIETRVLRNISNGGIILLHDGVQQTVDLLPQLLAYLEKRGYAFLTIDEMIGRPAGPPVRPPQPHRDRPQEQPS